MTRLIHQDPAEIDGKIAALQMEEARLRQQLLTVRAQQEPLNEEYVQRGGWTRAFLVTDGHVHKTTACSTCFPTTKFYWLTELSGMTEEQIVEAAGERACTVCFPSAPVNTLKQKSTLFTPEERDREAERAARADAKARRESDKRKNAPTKSGEPLTVQTYYRETFKTERAAMIWAVQEVEYRLGYAKQGHDYDGYPQALETVLAAVAEKRGVEVDVVRAEVEAKGAKKAAAWVS
jgi:hypothetical protein